MKVNIKYSKFIYIIRMYKFCDEDNYNKVTNTNEKQTRLVLRRAIFLF